MQFRHPAWPGSGVWRRAIAAPRPLMARLVAGFTIYVLPGLLCLSLIGIPLTGCSGEDGHSYDDDEPTATSPTPVPVVLEPSLLPDGKERAAYSAQLEASGGTPPYRFDILSGEIPYGLHLDPDTGLISGTPSYAASYSFTIRVLDAADQTDSEPLTINITPWNTPVQIACGDSFTVPLTESAYSEEDGVYVFDSESAVTFYEVMLPPAETTVMSLTATSPDGDPAVFVGRPGQPIGSELVAYYTLRGLQPGNEEVRIHDASTPSLADYLSYGANISAVVAATTPGEMTFHLECGVGAVLVDPFLPNASAGSAYATTLSAVGGTPPYVFSAPEGLPGGLELSEDGVLSGGLSTEAVLEVALRVDDSTGLGELRRLQLWAPPTTPISCDETVPVTFSTWAFNGQEGLATIGGAAFFELTVPEDVTEVVLEPALGGDFTVGVYQGFPGLVAGSSRENDYVHVAWDSPADDPDPVQLPVDTVILPTLPEYEGLIPLALAARDGFGDATLTVTCDRPLAVTSPFLANGALEALYSAQTAAGGGTAPYGRSASGLPEGLEMLPDGTVIGTPLASGKFTPMVTVTDDAGATATRSYAMSVGEVGAPAACGKAVAITCDDFAAGTLTAVGWVDRVELDLTVSGGAAFYCLEFPPESEAVQVTLENNSGDADLFLGYPGMSPGDTDDGHYWYFSSLSGDDALTLDDARFPPVGSYAGLAGVAVVAYEPGQFLLSIECDLP